MIGCASFEGTDPRAYACGIEFPASFCQGSAGLELPRPSATSTSPWISSRRTRSTRRRPCKALPPLIKGYLRVRAFVGDGAVIDHQFGTTDVLMIMPSRKDRSALFRSLRRPGRAEEPRRPRRLSHAKPQTGLVRRGGLCPRVACSHIGDSTQGFQFATPTGYPLPAVRIHDCRTLSVRSGESSVPAKDGAVPRAMASQGRSKEAAGKRSAPLAPPEDAAVPNVPELDGTAQPDARSSIAAAPPVEATPSMAQYLEIKTANPDSLL